MSYKMHPEKTTIMKTKKLSLASKLRRNLRMGKMCRVEFRKTDGSLARCWVELMLTEKIKSPKDVIRLWDMRKDVAVCCRAEDLIHVETMAQYQADCRAYERSQKVVEIADYFGIGISDAWKLYLAKGGEKVYEEMRAYEEAY